MKLETLTLERYGRFADLTLDLIGNDVRLHIVFGPNEAGKSTRRWCITRSGVSRPASGEV